MRHRVKKAKFKSGYDSGKSLKKKLVKNFILNGKIVATDKKVKFLKSHIQVLMGHAKSGSVSSRNYLLRHVGDTQVVDLLIKHISPVFKSRSGGYVKNQLLPQRASDGARMASMEWVEPVVLPTKEPKKEITKENVSQAKAKEAKETKVKREVIKTDKK